MADGIRERAAKALVWTTNEIEPGRGSSGLFQRGAAMYLDDLRRWAPRSALDQFWPFYALRVLHVEEPTGGAEVEVGKTRAGVLMLLSNSCIIMRDLGLARTKVEEFSLSGCHAEPVTAIVKGKKSAAFRITGNQQRLYVLDPTIGNWTKKQVGIRDRLVARINGELQAGPGLTLSGPMWHAPVRIVDPADEYNDPRSPLINSSAELILGDEEKIIFSGRYMVAVSRAEPTAYGGGIWKPSTVCSAPASVSITNRRAAVVWPDWQTTDAAPVLIQRRRRAGFADAATGSLAAVQLTWDWVNNIFVNNKPGAEADPTSLEFQAPDPAGDIRLRILAMSPEDSGRLSREVAAAVAAHRLRSRDDISEDTRAALDLAQRGDPSITRLEWGEQIVLPWGYYIAREPNSSR